MIVCNKTSLQVDGTWERGAVIRLLPAGGCLVELVDTGRVGVVARAETRQLSPELLRLPRQVESIVYLTNQLLIF